jgi:hypothetical protein
MDRRIAFVGALVFALGIVFIGVSRISYQKEEYWYRGDGTVSREADSETIFFEDGNRWTIENVSYRQLISETNQSVSQPTDNLTVSLYGKNGTQVTQLSYGDLKQMPTGLPVPSAGLYTIKIENIDLTHTVSATFVRWALNSGTIFPHNYLFDVGILVLLVGAGITAYGAVKRSPMPKQTR